MLHLENGCRLIQEVSDLPNLSGAKELFLDVETQSWDPKRGGLRPFHGDRICGVAVTVDEEPSGWYIPVRHTDEDWNIEVEPFQRWLKDTVTTAKDWINHNIVFDAHFCAQDGAEFTGRLVDTLILSKLHDSDRFTYGLKELNRDWRDRPMEEVDKVAAYLHELKSKNFADVPADMLGEYAVEDVIENRGLYRYVAEKCPSDMSLVWENEIKLTPVMYDIEKFGMPVDVQEIQIEKLKCVKRQIDGGAELMELIGEELNPASNPQIYDLMINQLGLPIVSRNKNNNPSFDKEALALYQVHPAVIADPKIARIVELIKETRGESHFQGLFLDPYLDLNVEGILHPRYNQCIRTGRMSCSTPNAQQLNTRAKALIHPLPGQSIMSMDYSQIEFRLIVHYIQDQDAIASYNEDPRTDFHQWVADQCGIKRGPGKILNFAMGYGAGKRKVVSMLVPNPDIISEVSRHINAQIAAGKIEEKERDKAFRFACEDLAETMFNIYHERLPGIKATAARAARIAKRRGYVFNAYGRRRHLPARFCYRGFNSIAQSCAADVIKDCVLRIAPRYNKWVRDAGINIFAMVHDSVDVMAPSETIADPEIRARLKAELESPAITFRVPIITDMGFSHRNWAEAGADDPIYDENDIQIAGPFAA